MKRLKYFVIICTLSFLLSGCVKLNMQMDIKKDKSMTLSIIYALDSSLIGNEKIISDQEKSNMEQNGFTFKDYNKDNMKGYVISKKIKNIDKVSSENETVFDILDIFSKNSNENYIFNVKKGLIKDTYYATLKFSNNNLESFNENMTSTESDININNLPSNVDLNFSVKIPYKAISNNATKVSNNDRDLTWKITSNGAEPITFAFELYNIKFICFVGGLALILLIVIFTASSKRKKKMAHVRKSNIPIIPSQSSNNNIQ